MIFLAPIAAAGYMWHKQRKERLEQEKAAQGEGDEQSDCNSSEESSQEKSWDFVDDADQPKKSPSVATEVTISLAASEDLSEVEELETPTVTPRADTARAGPMAKFHKFCDNLEKEFAKSQERKEQEGELNKDKEQEGEVNNSGIKSFYLNGFNVNVLDDNKDKEQEGEVNNSGIDPFYLHGFNVNALDDKKTTIPKMAGANAPVPKITFK